MEKIKEQYRAFVEKWTSPDLMLKDLKDFESELQWLIRNISKEIYPQDRYDVFEERWQTFLNQLK